MLILTGFSHQLKHRKSEKLLWHHNSKLSFCFFFFFFLLVFLSSCLFVFLSGHHSDQMSEGSQVSKVTICVNILKWQWVIDSLTHWPRSGIELPGQLKTSFTWVFSAMSAKVISNKNITLGCCQRWLRWDWPCSRHIWPTPYHKPHKCAQTWNIFEYIFNKHMITKCVLTKN